jgi:hypothetical protein
MSATTPDNKDVKVVETVTTPVEGTLAPLTPREIAIAQGKDPDAVQEEPEHGQESEEGQENAQVLASEGRAGTEAQGGEEGSSGNGLREPTGETEVSRWVTPEVVAMAESYGLSQDDLDDFESEADFRRMTRLADRSLMNAASQRDQYQKYLAQQQALQRQPAPVAPAPVEQIPDDETLANNGYDEDYIRLARNTRAMQQELAAVKQFVAGQQRVNAVQEHTQRLTRFHDAVDELSPERFGRTIDKEGNLVPLDPKHNEAREKLYNAADAMLREMTVRSRQAGVPPRVPPLSVLLRRAEQSIFAKEIRDEERQAFQQRVSEQSRRRRPAAGRPRVGPVPRMGDGGGGEEVDPVKAIANHPSLVAWWNKTQEENGA